MTKAIFLSVSLLCMLTISKAQTTAMQFAGVDCNGNAVDLFADMDAGKAVVLFYYMPSCGSCPPPAQTIQAMANHINATHPGKVKGYAFPYQNSTTCSYSSTWVSSNNLSTIYAPMDSGATQVAYYGGFGMPTVVVVGGQDHKVLFSTQSFSTGDTTTMRDAILAMLNGTTGLSSIREHIQSVNVFPNPATHGDRFYIELNIIKQTRVRVEVLNMLGQVVSLVYDQKATGVLKNEIPTTALGNGVYFVRVSAGSNSESFKFTITH